MTHTPRWFEYDWNVDENPARFVVDVALSEFPRGEYPTLIYISCEPKKPDGRSLTSFEEGRADALMKKIIKAIDPLYAGYIETSLERQYYLYCAGNESADLAEVIASKERSITCGFGSAHEPHWVTYEKLLCPDAAKLQTELNREKIEQMKKHGDETSMLRRVAFYMFFPNEQAKLMFSEQARLKGFAIGESVYTPDFELAHGVELVKITSLRKRDVDTLTTLAIHTAQTFGGEMRYWISPMARSRS